MSRRHINWPKPYTTALTREQIRIIVRIYLVDRKVRREIGFAKGTYGLMDRLAQEFGVKRKLIKDIIGSIGHRSNRFKDIKLTRETIYVAKRKTSLARYRRPAGDRPPDPDPAGDRGL